MTARRSSSPGKPGIVIGGLALVIVLGGWFAVQAFRGAAAAAAEKERVLAAAAAAAEQQPVDTAQLSRCVVDLQRIDGHDSDPECRFALARIELARDRAERAEELFAAIGGKPDAPPAWQQFVARVLLRRQEGDVGERTVAVLRQVVELSRSAYAESRDAVDLLRGWQAAVRLADDAASKAFAQQLDSEQADSEAARFVRFASGFEPSQGVAAIAAAAAGIVPEPAEARAMRAMATLHLGDAGAALTLAEAALAYAPGVPSVRQATILAFHAAALGSPASSAERTRWLERRDVQIDWLVALPCWPEDRRVGLRALRDQR